MLTALNTALSALWPSNGLRLPEALLGLGMDESALKFGGGNVQPLTGDEVKALLFLSAGFNLAGKQIQSHWLPVGLDTA